MSQDCRKISQKSKFTAQQRLTVPLGFLQSGVSSGFVQKKTKTQDDLRRAVLTERLPLEPSPENREQYSRDRSKSLLKQLEEKWTRPRSPSGDKGNSAGRPADYDYAYKEELWRRVAEVNSALAGQNPPTATGSPKMSSQKKPKRQPNEDNKENVPVSHLKVPKSNWVFSTPPNRKLHFEKIKMAKGGLEPAVVAQDCNKKIVYGVRNHDFPVFPPIEVKIDQNLVRMEDSEDSDDPNGHEDASCDLERYFLSLSCRPKKRHGSRSRCANGEPRPKRDAFRSPERSSEMDVEESFTFKFTPSRSSAPGPFTVGQLFDREGKETDSFRFRCDRP